MFGVYNCPNDSNISKSYKRSLSFSSVLDISSSQKHNIYHPQYYTHILFLFQNADIGQSYLSYNQKITNPVTNDLINIDYHIVYSISYEVPIMYFQAHHGGKSPIIQIQKLLKYYKIFTIFFSRWKNDNLG